MSASMARGSPRCAARTRSSTLQGDMEPPEGSAPLDRRRTTSREITMGTRKVTVIGGGIAGLVASIAAAEAGASVTLHEAHRLLGGRARSTSGGFVANHGPHAIYADGPFWGWLRERRLTPPVARPLVSGIRFRRGGTIRRTPPAAF